MQYVSSPKPLCMFGRGKTLRFSAAAPADRGGGNRTGPSSVSGVVSCVSVWWEWFLLLTEVRYLSQLEDNLCLEIST